MNAENKLSLKGIYRIVSILVPVLTVLAVYLGLLYKNQDTYKMLISCSAYVLAFSFVYVFIIRILGISVLKRPAAAVIAIAAPIVGFFSVHLGALQLAAIAVFTVSVLLGTVIDLGLGLFSLTGICGYLLLFDTDEAVSIAPFIIFTFLCCVLVKFMKDQQSLVSSAVIAAVFYVVILVITSGFVLSKAFIAENIITGIILEIILFAMFFVKKLLPVTLEATVTDSALLDSLSNEIDNLKNCLASDEERISLLIEENSRLSDNAVASLKEAQEAKITLASQPVSNYPISVAEAINPEYDFIKSMKKESPKMYAHCSMIADLSKDAAELIGCDGELAYAFGIYHEAQRFLGDDFKNILINRYRIPNSLARIIEIIKAKSNTNPIPREAGIVILSDDILGTINYLKNKQQNENVSTERIVTNAIRVRKDQNVLRLAGFTNEELQLLKLFFIEKGDLSE